MPHGEGEEEGTGQREVPQPRGRGLPGTLGPNEAGWGQLDEFCSGKNAGANTIRVWGCSKDRRKVRWPL